MLTFVSLLPAVAGATEPVAIVTVDTVFKNPLSPGVGRSKGPMDDPNIDLIPIDAFGEIAGPPNDDVARFRNNNFDTCNGTPLISLDEDVFSQTL